MLTTFKAAFSQLRHWNRRRNYFMKEVRLKLAKLLFDKKYQPFELKKISKVLFLRDDDKFGDMVVSTISFRELKKVGFRVSVVSGQKNQEVIQYNHSVENIFILKRSLCNIIKLALRLRKEKFDLIIDIGDDLTPSYLLFIRLINAKDVLGFNKQKYSLYDINIDYKNRANHISDRHFKLLKKLDVPNICLDYDLPTLKASEDSVLQYLAQFYSNKIIVLNPFTAVPQKDMSAKQCSDLIHLIQKNFKNITIIIVGVQNRIEQLVLPSAEKFPFKHFMDVVSLVKNAELIISPDTSLVHVATAFKKRTVALYRKDKVDGCSSVVWGPNNENAIQLFTPQEFGRVASIDSPTIFEAAKAYLNRVYDK